MELSEVLICGGLGLAVLIGGVSWGAKNYRTLRTFVRAQGVIVAWSAKDHVTNTYWTPVVEFRSSGGETVRFHGATESASNRSSAPETGEKVAVLYEAGHPANARINSFVQFWLAPVGLLAMGLSLILVPLYLFLKA